MRIKWLIPIALILIAAVLMTFSFVSCSDIGGANWAGISANPISMNSAANTTNNNIKVYVALGDSVKTLEMSEGTVAQAISKAGYDESQYDTDVALTDKVSDGMVIHLTARDQTTAAPVEETTEAENGDLQPNSIVGDENDGFYYVNDKGVIDKGYCDGVNVDGVDWNVINGKATQVADESDATLHSALQAVAKWTDSSMTKEEKLRKCFDTIKTAYLEGVPHDPPYREMDWPIVCANDLFVNGKGDCYSYGAAFAFIAKAIGYEETYACNSGGHGWAEVEGKFYDPEWDIHNHDYNHFGVAPDDDCDVKYVRGLAPGEPWMRLKV